MQATSLHRKFSISICPHLVRKQTKNKKQNKKNKKNKKKCRLLSMLLGTFGASLLGDLLIGKDTIIAAEER